ncbi:MAG: RNA polymerase sigma factor [Steroidobacteraceae bacterium]
MGSLQYGRDLRAGDLQAPPPKVWYLIGRRTTLSVGHAMSDQSNSFVERLFQRHGGALRAYFIRRVRRGTDAAELAQEVYLRLLRIPDVATIRNPEAYLYTVAGNLLRERALQQRRDAAAVDIDDPAVSAQLAEWPGFGRDLDDSQRARRLLEVLRQLPPKCQAAVQLNYWHDRSYEEIAAQLGVSTNMVKKYLSQALVHCRRRMARLG